MCSCALYYAVIRWYTGNVQPLYHPVGTRFGRLTVISDPIRRPAGNRTRTFYVCRCDCGGEITALGENLRRPNHTQSCGCLQRERTSQASVTHNQTHTRLYSIWLNMRNRCYNTKVKCYQYYGGRGITVCPEWHSSFAAFQEWALRAGYRDHLLLDRIDNDGSYHPDNCRWATRVQQMRNKRDNVWLTAWGETKLFTDWLADPRCTAKRSTIQARLNRGVAPEIAILA